MEEFSGTIQLQHGLVIPLEPYEVLFNRGRFKVLRNTALVAEVIAMKERRVRTKLNYEDGVLPNS